MKKRGILLHVWGDEFAARAGRLLSESALPDYIVYLVTDRQTPLSIDHPRLRVIRGDFRLAGKMRKAELVHYLPNDVDTLLYLDVDVRVIGDVSLGFEKAEQHGLAMAQAAHYSLDAFQNFRSVMESEGFAPRGQLQYNTGVIFFSLEERVLQVFRLAHELAVKYADEAWSDQPYVSLALEMLGFNPYTLSTSYNHRGFGELISGEVRVWHSYHPVPDDLNDATEIFPRRYENGRIINPGFARPGPS